MDRDPDRMLGTVKNVRTINNICVEKTAEGYLTNWIENLLGQVLCGSKNSLCGTNSGIPT